jgi:hypothetical protein
MPRHSVPTGGWKTVGSTALAVILVASFAALPPAVADNGAAGAPPPASVERTLEAQESLIRDLLRRIEALERRTKALQSATNRLGGPGVGGAIPVVARPTPGTPLSPGARPAVPAAEVLPDLRNGPQVSPPSAGGEPAPQGGQAGGKAAPGQIEIDEEAAARALERTLVQAGALLLPFGKAEVQPSFTYTRRDDSFQASALLPGGGAIVTGQDRVRRDEFEQAVELRIGLPFDTQLELGLPYAVVQSSTVSTNGGTSTKSDRWGHGVGDLRVGLAKTVVRAKGWRPDVVARVTWDSKTGERVDNDVVVGSSVDELRGSLTALKQQDPLAFIGSVFYEHAFKDGGFQPGKRLGFSLGAALAASPETSLTLSFNQTFVDDVRINNRVVEGSDQTQATIAAGVSTILTRNTLLALTAGAGLTDDSPDYFVLLSLPVRFDVPMP